MCVPDKSSGSSSSSSGGGGGDGDNGDNGDSNGDALLILAREDHDHSSGKCYYL